MKRGLQTEQQEASSFVPSIIPICASLTSDTCRYLHHSHLLCISSTLHFRKYLIALASRHQLQSRKMVKETEKQLYYEWKSTLRCSDGYWGESPILRPIFFLHAVVPSHTNSRPQALSSHIPSRSWTLILGQPEQQKHHGSSSFFISLGEPIKVLDIFKNHLRSTQKFLQWLLPPKKGSICLLAVWRTLKGSTEKHTTGWFLTRDSSE